jgi:NAD(P)-dependent dehydrogenase (short-subunit alcohol dehydrogenase family)
MKKVLIIGATGTIGKAVAKASKLAGFDTTEASRNTNPSIDIESPESVEKFFSEHSAFDAIICVAGNASFGPIDKLSEKDMLNSFNSKLMGQVRLVKAALNVLKEDGAIVLTGGIFAYEPWPETSAVAMVNAGLEGFVRAAAKEFGANRKVCIIHPPLVAESAQQMGMDPAPWPRADAVAANYLLAITEAENGQAWFLKGFEPKQKELHHAAS